MEITPETTCAGIGCAQHGRCERYLRIENSGRSVDMARHPGPGDVCGVMIVAAPPKRFPWEDQMDSLRAQINEADRLAAIHRADLHRYRADIIELNRALAMAQQTIAAAEMTDEKVVATAQKMAFAMGGAGVPFALIDEAVEAIVRTLYGVELQECAMEVQAEAARARMEGGAA